VVHSSSYLNHSGVSIRTLQQRLRCAGATTAAATTTRPRRARQCNVRLCAPARTRGLFG
jgi:hypothetical protein